MSSDLNTTRFNPVIDEYRYAITWLDDGMAIHKTILTLLSPTAFHNIGATKYDNIRTLTNVLIQEVLLPLRNQRINEAISLWTSIKENEQAQKKARAGEGTNDTTRQGAS